MGHSRPILGKTEGNMEQEKPIVDLLATGDMTETGAIVILYNALMGVKRDVRTSRDLLAETLKQVTETVELTNNQIKALETRVARLEADAAENPTIVKLLKTKPKQTVGIIIGVIVLIILEFSHWVSLGLLDNLPIP